MTAVARRRPFIDFGRFRFRFGLLRPDAGPPWKAILDGKHGRKLLSAETRGQFVWHAPREFNVKNKSIWCTLAESIASLSSAANPDGQLEGCKIG